MNPFTGLSIIIPTVDETRGIAETLEILGGICEKDDIAEILIVHSQDSSESHVSSLFSLAERFPELNVKVLAQPGKGLGDALFYGCCLSTGSHFLMIGADRENDPSAVKEMLALAKLHPDTVITTSRTIEKDGLREYSAFKRLLGSAFRVFTRVCFGSRQTDITYAYQITPKAVFDPSFFQPDHSAFVLELALMADVKKLPLIEIPTKIKKRKEGVSHSGVRYYLRFATTAVTMLMKMKVGRWK